LALAALALVVFGAYDSYPTVQTEALAVVSFDLAIHNYLENELEYD